MAVGHRLGSEPGSCFDRLLVAAVAEPDQRARDRAHLHRFVLAESAGFRREGVLRSYWESGAGRLDAVVLSRLPGDAS